MPLFVCGTCLTVENTALGWYWGQPSGKYFCAECGEDGKGGGEWHGRFPKTTPEETRVFLKERRKEFYWTEGMDTVLGRPPSRQKAKA